MVCLLNKFSVLSDDYIFLDKWNNKNYLKNSYHDKTNYMIDIDQHKNSTWYTKNNLGSHKNKKNKKPKFNKEQRITKNRILCFNMLNSDTCSYENKCLYAHTLDEQTVDKNREKALNVLKMNNLKNIDLVMNKDLKNNLTVLTKLCNDCINNTCPGGYNCKYGACNKDVLICNADFRRGDCKNYIKDNKCINGFHLTLKNFVPLVKQQLLYDFPNEQFIRNNRSKNNLQEEWTLTKKKHKKKINGQRSLKSIIDLDNNNNVYNSDLLYDSEISSNEEIQKLDDVESEENDSDKNKYLNHAI